MNWPSAGSLYQAIINADWLFLVRRRSSDFTHALTAELTRVATCTYLLIGTVSNAILALVYIAIALKLSAGMTSLVLATGAVLLLMSRRWMRAVHQSGTAVSESVSEVYSAATEHLQNLKAMKFYDAQSSDLAMFSSLQSSALQQSLEQHQEPGSCRVLVRSRVARGVGRNHFRFAADSQCRSRVHSSLAGGLYPPFPSPGSGSKPVAGVPQRASGL